MLAAVEVAISPSMEQANSTSASSELMYSWTNSLTRSTRWNWLAYATTRKLLLPTGKCENTSSVWLMTPGKS